MYQNLDDIVGKTINAIGGC